MSLIQQLEEEQYDRDSEFLAIMQAEAFDPYADERSYYCETHDYEDYNNECPQCIEEEELEPAPDYFPDMQSEYDPPF